MRKWLVQNFSLTRTLEQARYMPNSRDLHDVIFALHPWRCSSIQPWVPGFDFHVKKPKRRPLYVLFKVKTFRRCTQGLNGVWSKRIRCFNSLLRSVRHRLWNTYIKSGYVSSVSPDFLIRFLAFRLAHFSLYFCTFGIIFCSLASAIIRCHTLTIGHQCSYKIIN